MSHGFSYPVFLYLFDLDELGELSKKIPFFRYNKLAPIAIHDKDYFKSEPGSIKEKLLRHFSEFGISEKIQKVYMLTGARYFNYVFNPVSFFYCFSEDGSLCGHVAEVNNTFSERHVYMLPASTSLAGTNFQASYERPKSFHVSPFYDMENRTYHFDFSSLSDSLDVRIDVKKDGVVDFKSRIWGKLEPLTTGSLCKTLVSYPITATLTMPRILWQAKKLYFNYKLPVYTKPIPQSSYTIQTAPPSIIERLCLGITLRYLEKLKVGLLEIELPDETSHTFGTLESKSKAHIRVKDYRFFMRVIFSGDIGFGESYVYGEWESRDVTAVIALFAKNFDHFDDRNIILSYLGRAYNQIKHWFIPNSIKGSKNNIHAHYDLSNTLFSTFLDSTMSYSSALYLSADDTLEQAQKNKIHAIIKKAQINSKDHVLEIGCGWGGLAIETVKATGCRMTCITVSEQQYELAKSRVLEAGLQDKISIELCDYRLVKGSYSKIISVEMLEAVGKEYFGEFFKTCDRLLTKDGLVVLQVITMADQRSKAYSISGDWIQKHIFPGCFIPTLTLLSEAATKHSKFVIEDLENIGVHYAKTLATWRENFLSRFGELEGQGFDERFKRAWVYYFSYCEAGFATRTLGDLHLVLSRPNNETLPGIN